MFAVSRSKTPRLDMAGTLGYELDVDFDQSIRRQITMNQARSPDERFAALCDLLRAAARMTPHDPDAKQRRQRIVPEKQRERERFRAEWSRLFAAYRASEGL